MRAQITREIMQGKDAQCNTGEWPQGCVSQPSDANSSKSTLTYLNYWFEELEPVRPAPDAKAALKKQ